MFYDNMADYIVEKFKAGQGFSVDANGAIIQGGYAVGLGRPVLKFPAREANLRHIKSWLINRRPETTNGAVIGGWVDPEGTAYLELSQLVGDKEHALMLGSLRGEQAIGDLALYSKGQDGTVWLDDKAA